jgi:hypothetical protein
MMDKRSNKTEPNNLAANVSKNVHIHEPRSSAAGMMEF